MAYLYKVERQADESPRHVSKVSEPNSWDYAFCELIKAMSKEYQAARTLLIRDRDSDKITPDEFKLSESELSNQFGYAVSTAALSSTTVNFSGYTYWITKVYVNR